MTLTLSRRDMILGALASAIAAAGPMGFPAEVFAQSDVTADQFLALSEKLTGANNLDPKIAETLLGGFLAIGHGPDLEQMVGQNFDSFIPLANAIVAVWYSGVYTTVPRGRGLRHHSLHQRIQKVATFNQALVWNALTFTKPWGNCGGETGYWGNPPAA